MKTPWGLAAFLTQVPGSRETKASSIVAAAPVIFIRL